MWISEQTFPHLTAAREERLTAELERRRVVRERLGEAPARSTRRLFRRAATGAQGERMPRTGREATSAGASGPRPA